MITTVDGQTLKRGAIAYGIGITIKDVYTPYRGVVHSSKYDLHDPENVYAKYANAQKECDRRNKLTETNKPKNQNKYE